jgi:zinc transporter ZupT
MMTRMPPDNANRVDPRFDPVFIESERNRFAARALAFLVFLNGAAALVLLSILARAPESTVEPKFASAMLFFSGGAVAALLSSFLAYINRTVAMEAPERANLRRVLQIFAIVVVIGSAASFMTGMNMVAAAASEKSSSHPKGSKEQRAPVVRPSEKVDWPIDAGAFPRMYGLALEHRRGGWPA